MSEQTALTAEVSKDLARRLDLLADKTRRTRSQLITEAIEEYVALQEWQVQAVQEGIAEADGGEFVSHEEVCEKLSRWGAG